VLDERWNHRASAVRFRDELEDHMSPDYAEDTLRTVIAWGRYAELFSYDEEAEQFLEHFRRNDANVWIFGGKRISMLATAEADFQPDLTRGDANGISGHDRRGRNSASSHSWRGRSFLPLMRP
jgi:hypothetical protein